VSFLSPAFLEGHKLIAEYIIEYRGRGHFLPYDDHRIIERWLELMPDVNSLLLILSDLVPAYYARAAERTQPPSLLRLDKKVRRILEVRRDRSGM
jgi:hypothetical protein